MRVKNVGWSLEGVEGEMKGMRSERAEVLDKTKGVGEDIEEK